MFAWNFCFVAGRQKDRRTPEKKYKQRDKEDGRSIKHSFECIWPLGHIILLFCFVVTVTIFTAFFAIFHSLCHWVVVSNKH